MVFPKRLAWVSVAFIGAACGGGGARCPATPAAPEVELERCRIEGADVFDFLLGRWRGTERAIDDTGAEKIVATTDIVASKVLGGCAIEERWTVRDGDSKVLFHSLLLRSFDRATRRWMLSYVDDDLSHQLYEGRPHDGGWAFHRTRETDDGKTVHVRIVWKRSARGVEQIIERSTDGGITWVRSAVVELITIRA